jgi:hypothetical protein
VFLFLSTLYTVWITEENLWNALWMLGARLTE